MLQGALNEVRSKIAARECSLGLPTFFQPPTPFTAPGLPYVDSCSAMVFPGLYRRDFLSSLSLGYPQTISHPCTRTEYPYAYNPYLLSTLPVQSPFVESPFSPNPFLQNQYLSSPYPMQLQEFHSPMPYSFSPMSVPISRLFHPQCIPPAGRCCESFYPDSGTGLRAVDLGPSADCIFRLSDAPANRHSTIKPASPRNIPDEPSVQPPALKPTSFDLSFTPMVNSRRYSAAAADLLIHRLGSTKLNGHRRGQLSTASNPEECRRAKSLCEAPKGHSVVHV
jgi:hypothetical protein